MNTVQKVGVLSLSGGEESMNVSHLTVRLSIYFLLIKIIAVELIFTFIAGLFHIISVFNNPLFVLPSQELYLFVLISFFILKLFMMSYIIVQWVQDYYEITPTTIIHRRGIIFKKDDVEQMRHLGELRIQQGFFGKLFNYGTLNLNNWYKEKDFTMLLIHNPWKYYEAIEKLLPVSDEEKDFFREHLIEPEREYLIHKNPKFHPAF